MALLKRTGLFSNDTQGAKIIRATTLEDFIGAYRLAHDMFVQQGYIHPNESGIRVRSFEALPETATFIAKVDDEVVGVTGVVIDSPELGLPTDKIFKNVVDVLRDQGRKICEGTNWLVADSHRNSAVMTELMRCSFAHALAFGCKDFLGAVSPGHARFYKLLGFDQIGEVRSYSKDIEDLVVLVRLKTIEHFETMTLNSSEADLFVKKYYLDENPYHKHVKTWQIMSDRFFSDVTLLTELFVHRSDLLGRCSRSELEAIRERWGDKLFAEVMAHSLAAVA